jgi:5-methylcytosine-specific restriction endonuclease McrA
MEKTILKECKKHGLTEFVLRADGRYRCKKCASEAVQKRREKTKELLVEYKGGKCEICGYDKCVEALEFHHINPDEKDFGIGHKGYTRSFERNKAEVDKCILVCANCHREIHSGLIDINKILGI